jgi:hypothetical protein
MPETEPFTWNLDHLVQGFQYLMKNNKIDSVVALDDFDVEKAAMIRETFRIREWDKPRIDISVISWQ